MGIIAERHKMLRNVEGLEEFIPACIARVVPMLIEG